MLFWYIYACAFLLGVVLPVHNMRLWVKSCLKVMFVSLGVIIFFSLATARQAGAGLVLLPVIAFFGVPTVVAAGLAAGLYVRGIVRRRNVGRGVVVAVVLLALPVLIGSAWTFLSEREDAAARNAVWTQHPVVQLGDMNVHLPLSPRFHLVYLGADGNFYGGNLKRQRSLEEFAEVLVTNSGPLVLSQLIVLDVALDCDGPSRAYCEGVSGAQLRDWCTLVPSEHRSVVCVQDADDARFRVYFQTRGNGLTIADGDCVNGRCYTRIDISPQIELIVSFDAALSDSGAIALDAITHGKRLWNGLITLREQ